VHESKRIAVATEHRRQGITDEALPNFSATITGRASHIEQVQGQRSVLIDSELLIGNPMLVLCGGGIRKWNDGSMVPPQERTRVIENIQSALGPKWGEIEIDMTPYK
jgi:hypothetical protein